MTEKIESNVEILKRVVEAMDKLGKQYERIKKHIEIMKELNVFNLPQLLNDINDEKKGFLHAGLNKELAGILEHHRYKILEFAEFVEKEGDEEYD